MGKCEDAIRNAGLDENKKSEALMNYNNCIKKEKETRSEGGSRRKKYRKSRKNKSRRFRKKSFFGLW
jgi:hypothetical protein